MATQNIKTTIIPRKDTYANWTASTAKVLAAGEFGLDTTNNILKCGDGTNTWANLPELNETTLSDLGITATAAEINKLDGLTATTAELNYVDGVTSAIQTQLDNKAPKSHASSGTTYGVATTSNYGHVKISNGDVATVSSANGLAAGMDHSHSNYANQNAFSNVKVGSTTVAADTATDTLELVAGTNITITPDATNDKITISATDTVYTHPSTHDASMITGLATVATSGSYNDLSNKPTIPTVNNGTLTIQGNGTAASTFTANQSGNTTLNIKGSGGTTVTKSANNEITISTGTIPTGAAASKGVDTSISAASTSTNLPTSKAVAAFVEGKGYKTTDNDTKNTAGASNKTGTKLYLVGTTAQSTGTSYSNSNVYIGDNNKLYSNGQEVSTTSHTHSAYVKNTGDESISGFKSFNDGVEVGMGTFQLGNDQFGGELIYSPSNVPILVESSGDVILIGINDEGRLELNDVVTPTENGDAANKEYVDTEVAKKADATHTHTKSQITDFPTKLSQFTNDSGYTKNTGTVTSVKIAAGTGLSVDSTSAITTSGTRTLSLAASGVTADTYGPSADVTGTNGTTITVPEITVDTYGRVTGVTERTYTSKDTNTHYTTGLYVGATNTKSNASTSNGGTYLKLYDDSTKRAEFKVTGSGATSVSSDASGNITISSTNTTYSDATTSASGLMSSSDKSKLNGIASGANKYIHPTGTGSSKASGLYKFSTDSGSHISGVTEVTKDDITALGIPAQDTTYSAATTSAAGLMSAADKTKLNGIASGATANKGTVTSVTIKAGTGLTSSSTSAITTSGERTISIASGYKLPTTTEWDNKVEKTYTSGGITNSIVNGDNGIWLESGINYITVDPDVISMGVNDSNFVEINDSGMSIEGDLGASSVYANNIYATDGTATAEIGIGLNSVDDEATLSLKNSSSQYLTISGSGTFYKGSYSAALPLKSGTIALTSDIPTSIAWTSVTGKPSTFTPPTATSNVLGGVKTSTGITNSSGTISVAYGTTAGTACQGNDSRLSDSRTPKAHNQASNTINAMTGYSKASAASAISTSDSLNTAIGKLEKALDGKGTSNLTLGTTSTTAAKGNHTHDYSSTYAPKSHTHDYLSTSGGTLTNSSSGNAVLTIANGSYQPKLTFSASGGGHNPTISLAPYASGSTTGSYTVYLPAKNGTLATTDDLSNRAVLSSQNAGSGGIIVTDGPDSIIDSGHCISTGETFSTATASEIPTKGAISTYLGSNFASKSHTHSSYANQNAFSNVKVVKSGGGTSDVTVAADTTTDTVTFEGNNITITGDATNDKVTFGLTKTNVTTALGYTPPTQDTTYSAATTSAAGLMSAADKTKLNGIAENANNYSLPTAGSTLGGVKTTSTVTSTSGLTACPIISGVPYYKDTNTQSAYGNVTTSGTITAAAVTTASGVVVVDSSNKIQKVTSMSDFRTIIGAGTSNLTIGTGASNAAAGNHTHKYAGSSSAGGAANSVKTNLTIKLNGGSVEDTSLFTFNGSTAKTINITPAAIGALSVYNADDSDTWDTTTTSKLPTKRSVAAYTAANFAEKGHKHTASLATDTGTSAITLGHGGKYKLTAGGSSVIFTMPSATYLATKLGASAGLAGGSSEGDYTGYLPILKNAPSSTSENSVCYLASGMSTYAGATKMTFGSMIGNIGGVRLGDSSSLSNNVWVSGFVLNQTPTNAMQHMPLAMWSDPSNTYSAGLGLTSSGVINLRTTGMQILVRNSESNVLDPTSYDGYTFTFPNKNGTIALTSDIPTLKTINGNSITGSGDLTITADVPSDIDCNSISVSSDISISCGALRVNSDEVSGVQNSPFGDNNADADIDAYYYSNGIKVENLNDGGEYELAFPARSGILSLKGHTHTVSCVGSIDYGIYHKNATLYSSNGSYASSYCGNSYATSKIYADIDSIGISTSTLIKVQVYSETNSLLKTIEVTGRRLLQWVPNWDDYSNGGAMGSPNYTLLFEKFNDTDFWCAGTIYTATSSNSSTRVSRVVITYSDHGDSGLITLQEISTKKTSATSKTSGGSNY